MIGTSTSAFIFIRACILFLNSITPISFVYCFLVYPLHLWNLRLPWWIELYLASEVAFYALVYLPLTRYYQRPAKHPAKPTLEARRELFHRCHNTLKDPETYLRKWFKNAAPSEIRRENVKEFLAWAFFNADHTSAMSWDSNEDAELEGYVDAFESLLGRRIPPGRGTATSLRLTFDKHHPLHRSLLWYACVGFVDLLAFAHMRYHGFHFHRSPGRFAQLWRLFPFRPVTLLARGVSPSHSLTYWHRAHTSKTNLPILFIHGIGIGLYPYVRFLGELNTATAHLDANVGIIALEIHSISFRITPAPLTPAQLCTEVLRILAHHGWPRVVLVSHSYGSVLSTHMLHHPALGPRIGPVLLVDPVCFLLHLPDVAYNFTVRAPREANEWQLWYFASKDLGVSWTLARHFFWADNILWREDLVGGGGRAVTVSLGGRDLIVDTQAIGEYLVGGGGGDEVGKSGKKRDDDANNNNTPSSSWKTAPWTARTTSPEVVWWPELDHAQVFDKKRTRAKLIGVLKVYCAMK